MRRALAVVQALVYGAVAWELRRRWAFDAGAFVVAALAQAAVAALPARSRWIPPLAATSLLAALLVWGRFFYVALHVKAVLGPETGAQLAQTVGATVVAIPWLLALPLVQLASTPWRRATFVTPLAALPGLLLPTADAPVRLDPSVWRAAAPRRAEVFPGFFVPSPSTSDKRWSAPPALDSAAIDDAIGAGVAFLARHMKEDGTFTYIVKGPSGAPGPGYNYPRHAGTTWFLARVAVALAESRPAAAAEAAATARIAMRHLAGETRWTDDGRAYVIDPGRRDGKAWVGTTALAALAEATLPLSDRVPGLLEGYARQLAASVDGDGKVRGEMTIAGGTFPDQAGNPYGQGQATLALAVLDRGGFDEGAEALTRAMAFLDTGYYGSPWPLATGDEHWTCLAVHAIEEARKVAPGRGVCAAYVAQERWTAPVDGGGLPPAAGPAGGAAEAVVAHAWDTRDAALVDLPARFGRLFLQNQYRAADVAGVGLAEGLVGGFRDGPGDLDVQIDAVQHIGCALLGIEATLAGRARPGSFP